MASKPICEGSNPSLNAMNDSDRILFADRIMSMIPKPGSDEVPVMVGTLNKRQGLKGFVVAELGHPVFEYKDRYLMYMESETPEKISKYGEPVVFSIVKVCVPYYKDDLAPIIDFIK